MGLRGFARLNFDSGWGKGPNHTRGIEPATFSTAALPCPSDKLAIAQWESACVTNRCWESRGLNPRGVISALSPSGIEILG